MAFKKLVPICAFFVLMLASGLALASQFGNTYSGTGFTYSVPTSSIFTNNITFVARENARINSVGLLLYKTSPSDDSNTYSIEIRADNAGKPGTLLATSDPITGTDEIGKLWKTFTIAAASQPTLVAGTKYHVILNMPASAQASGEGIVFDYINGLGQPSTLWQSTLAEGNITISTSTRLYGSPGFALYYADASGNYNGQGDGNPYDTITSGQIYGGKWVAQTFSLPRALTVNSLSVLARKVNATIGMTPFDDLYAQITDTSGTAVGAQLKVALKGTLNDSYAYRTGTYSSGLFLVAGTYQIVLSSPSSNSTTFYRWLALQTNLVGSNPLLEKTFAGTSSAVRSSTDSGATWANLTNIDHSFIVDTVEPTCSDGTAIWTCSTSKPKYCNGQISLVDNATVCGCPAYQQNFGTSSCVADTLPPSSYILGLDTVLNGAVTLNISASDNAGWGVSRVQYEQSNATPFTTWNNLTATGFANTTDPSISFSTAGLSNQVQLRSNATDISRNVEAGTPVSVLVDAVAPTGGSVQVNYPTGVDAYGGTYTKTDAAPGENVTLKLFSVQDGFGVSSVTPLSTTLPSLPSITFSKIAGERAVWLRMDRVSAGSTPDFSGYNNPGTLILGPVVNARGKFASGITLGSNQQIALANTPNGMSSANAYSVSIWFNPASLADRQNLTAIYDYSSSAAKPTQYGLLVFLEGNHQIVAQMGLGSSIQTFNVTLSGANMPAIGKWYHLVVTRSGTTLQTYLNGASLGSSAGLAGGAFSTRAMTVGSIDALANGFAGTVDDLQVWSKALSATDVTALYSGTPLSDNARYQSTPLTIPANLDDNTYTLNVSIGDTAIPNPNYNTTKQFAIKVAGGTGLAPARASSIPTTALVGAILVVALLVAGYSAWKPSRK